MQAVLLMRSPARGVIITDTHITTTVRVDAGTDTDHARLRPPLIRHLALRRCQKGWVLGIVRLVRDLPVRLRRRRTELAISSLDASLNYVANSKGKEKNWHLRKPHPGVLAHVHAPLSPTLHQLHALPPPNGRARLLPGLVHHHVHPHLSPHRPTFPLTASDRTCPQRWISTLKRLMILAWTLRRWFHRAFLPPGSLIIPSLKVGT